MIKSNIRNYRVYYKKKVTIDFIIKLLKLKELLIKKEYDIIFVIVDRFTKYS